MNAVTIKIARKIKRKGVMYFPTRLTSFDGETARYHEITKNTNVNAYKANVFMPAGTN